MTNDRAPLYIYTGTPERVEIPVAGIAGEKYTIDVIDNYFGGPSSFEPFQRTFAWGASICAATVSHP